MPKRTSCRIRPGLLLAARVDRACPGAGPASAACRRARPWSTRQRHPRGQQRVAAEQRHEPRAPRRRRRDRRGARVEDPQRAEVLLGCGAASGPGPGVGVSTTGMPCPASPAGARAARSRSTGWPVGSGARVETVDDREAPARQLGPLAARRDDDVDVIARRLAAVAASPATRTPRTAARPRVAARQRSRRPAALHPVRRRGRRTRLSFTSNRSAKSAATSRVSVQEVGVSLRFRSTMSSRMPSPTYLCRSTSSALSARPGTGRDRVRKVMANGSTGIVARGSG